MILQDFLPQRGSANSWSALTLVAKQSKTYDAITAADLSPKDREKYIAVLAQDGKYIDNEVTGNTIFSKASSQDKLGIMLAYTNQHYTNKVTASTNARTTTGAYSDAETNARISADLDTLQVSDYLENVNRQAFQERYGKEDKSDYDALGSYYDTLYSNYTKEYDSAKTSNTQKVQEYLDYVNTNNIEAQKKLDYENLNGWVKFFSTAGDLLIGTTVGAALEMVEGIIDAGMAVVGIFDKLSGKLDVLMGEPEPYSIVAEESAEIIAKDIIPTSTWRQTIFSNSLTQSKYASGFLADSAQFITGITDSLTRIGIAAVLNGVSGGILGTATYYTSMAGNTMDNTLNEAKANGLDSNFYQAFAYSVVSTGIEYFTEKISYDDWIGSGKLFRKTVGLPRMLGEAAEEVTSGILDPIAWNLIMGDNKDIDFKELGLAALSGFVTSGILQASYSSAFRRAALKVDTKIKTGNNEYVSVKQSTYNKAMAWRSSIQEGIKRGKTYSAETMDRYNRINNAVATTRIDAERMANYRASVQDKRYAQYYENLENVTRYTEFDENGNILHVGDDVLGDVIKEQGIKTRAQLEQEKQKTLQRIKEITEAADIKAGDVRVGNKNNVYIWAEGKMGDGEVTDKFIGADAKAKEAAYTESIRNAFAAMAPADASDEARKAGANAVEKDMTDAVDTIISISESETSASALQKLANQHLGSCSVTVVNLKRKRAQRYKDFEKVANEVYDEHGYTVNLVVTEDRQVPNIYIEDKAIFVRENYARKVSTDTLHAGIAFAIQATDLYNIVVNNDSTKAIIEKSYSESHSKLNIEVYGPQLIANIMCAPNSLLYQQLIGTSKGTLYAMHDYVAQQLSAGMEGGVGKWMEQVKTPTRKATKRAQTKTAAIMAKNMVEAAEQTAVNAADMENDGEGLSGTSERLAFPDVDLDAEKIRQDWMRADPLGESEGYFSFALDASEHAVKSRLIIDAFKKNFGFIPIQSRDTADLFTNLKNLLNPDYYPNKQLPANLVQTLNNIKVPVVDIDLSKTGFSKYKISYTNGSRNMQEALAQYINDKFSVWLCADGSLVTEADAREIIDFKELAAYEIPADLADKDFTIPLGKFLTPKGKQIMSAFKNAYILHIGSSSSPNARTATNIQGDTNAGYDSLVIRLFNTNDKFRNEWKETLVHETGHGIYEASYAGSPIVTTGHRTSYSAIEGIVKDSLGVRRDANGHYTQAPQNLKEYSNFVDSIKQYLGTSGDTKVVLLFLEELPRALNQAKTDADFNAVCKNAFGDPTTKTKAEQAGTFARIFQSLVYIFNTGELNARGISRKVSGEGFGAWLEADGNWHFSFTDRTIPQATVQEFEITDAVSRGDITILGIVANVIRNSGFILNGSGRVTYAGAPVMTVDGLKAFIMKTIGMPVTDALLASDNFWKLLFIQIYAKTGNAYTSVGATRMVKALTGSVYNKDTGNWEPVLTIPQSTSNLISDLDTDEDFMAVSSGDDYIIIDTDNTSDKLVDLDNGITLETLQDETLGKVMNIIFPPNNTDIMTAEATVKQVDAYNQTNPQDPITYFIAIDNQVFESLEEAVEYFSTTAGEVAASQLDTVFNNLLEATQKNPPQLINNTIIVARDGSYYCCDLSYSALVNRCKKLNIPEQCLGQIANPNSSTQITQQVSEYLSAKKFVRLVKRPEGPWDVFGRSLANRAQSSTIKELGNKISIFDIKNLANGEWVYTGRKWVDNITELFRTLNITDAKDLKAFGFTEDFIDHLVRSDKTTRKEGFNNLGRERVLADIGITNDYAVSYINDNENSKVSRNWLISVNPDWANNKIITSVETADTYIDLLSYIGTLAYAYDLYLQGYDVNDNGKIMPGPKRDSFRGIDKISIDLSQQSLETGVKAICKSSYEYTMLKNFMNNLECPELSRLYSYVSEPLYNTLAFQYMYTQLLNDDAAGKIKLIDGKTAATFITLVANQKAYVDRRTVNLQDAKTTQSTENEGDKEVSLSDLQNAKQVREGNVEKVTEDTALQALETIQTPKQLVANLKVALYAQQAARNSEQHQSFDKLVTQGETLAKAIELQANGDYSKYNQVVASALIGEDAFSDVTRYLNAIDSMKNLTDNNRYAYYATLQTLVNDSNLTADTKGKLSRAIKAQYNGKSAYEVSPEYTNIKTRILQAEKLKANVDFNDRTSDNYKRYSSLMTDLYRDLDDLQQTTKNEKALQPWRQKAVSLLKQHGINTNYEAFLTRGKNATGSYIAKLSRISESFAETRPEVTEALNAKIAEIQEYYTTIKAIFKPTYEHARTLSALAEYAHAFLIDSGDVKAARRAFEVEFSNLIKNGARHSITEATVELQNDFVAQLDTVSDISTLRGILAKIDDNFSNLTRRSRYTLKLATMERINILEHLKAVAEVTGGIILDTDNTSPKLVDETEADESPSALLKRVNTMLRASKSDLDPGKSRDLANQLKFATAAVNEATEAGESSGNILALAKNLLNPITAELEVVKASKPQDVLENQLNALTDSLVKEIQKTAGYDASKNPIDFARSLLQNKNSPFDLSQVAKLLSEYDKTAKSFKVRDDLLEIYRKIPKVVDANGYETNYFATVKLKSTEDIVKSMRGLVFANILTFEGTAGFTTILTDFAKLSGADADFDDRIANLSVEDLHNFAAVVIEDIPETRLAEAVNILNDYMVSENNRKQLMGRVETIANEISKDTSKELSDVIIDLFKLTPDAATDDGAEYIQNLKNLDSAQLLKIAPTVIRAISTENLQKAIQATRSTQDFVNNFFERFTKPKGLAVQIDAAPVSLAEMSAKEGRDRVELLKDIRDSLVDKYFEKRHKDPDVQAKISELLSEASSVGRTWYGLNSQVTLLEKALASSKNEPVDSEYAFAEVQRLKQYVEDEFTKTKLVIRGYKKDGTPRLKEIPLYPLSKQVRVCLLIQTAYYTLTHMPPTQASVTFFRISVEAAMELYTPNKSQTKNELEKTPLLARDVSKGRDELFPQYKSTIADTFEMLDQPLKFISTVDYTENIEKIKKEAYDNAVRYLEIQTQITINKHKETHTTTELEFKYDATPYVQSKVEAVLAREVSRNEVHPSRIDNLRQAGFKDVDEYLIVLKTFMESDYYKKAEVRAIDISKPSDLARVIIALYYNIDTAEANTEAKFLAECAKHLIEQNDMVRHNNPDAYFATEADFQDARNAYAQFYRGIQSNTKAAGLVNKFLPNIYALDEETLAAKIISQFGTDRPLEKASQEIATLYTKLQGISKKLLNKGNDRLTAIANLKASLQNKQGSFGVKAIRAALGLESKERVGKTGGTSSGNNTKDIISSLFNDTNETSTAPKDASQEETENILGSLFDTDNTSPFIDDSNDDDIAEAIRAFEATTKKTAKPVNQKATKTSTKKVAGATTVNKASTEKVYNKDKTKSTRTTARSKALPASAQKLLRVDNFTLKQKATADPNVTYNYNSFSSKQFIAIYANELTDFLTNRKDVLAFMNWLDTDPALNDKENDIVTLLLARIVSDIRTQSYTGLRERALKTLSEKRSQAAATLRVGGQILVTPIEAIARETSKMLSSVGVEFTEEDTNFFTAQSEAYTEAQANHDYNQTEKILVDTVDYVGQHYKQNIAPKYNVFDSNISAEERSRRIANWFKLFRNARYLALLSNPRTFWVKNTLGNLAAKGERKLAEQLGKLVTKGGISSRTNYRFNWNDNADKTAQKDAASNAIDKHVTETGLLDMIMTNTTAKYAGTVKYQVSSLNIEDFADMTTGEIARYIEDHLFGAEPFGNSKASVLLNRWYNAIFKVMEKSDQKYVREGIVAELKDLMAKNWTLAEIAELDSENEAVRKAAMAHLMDLISYVTNDVLKTYFKNTPKLYEKIMKALPPWAKAVLSVVFPFQRMAWNTAITIFDYSPAGLIKGIASASAAGMDAHRSAYDELGEEKFKEEKARAADKDFDKRTDEEKQKRVNEQKGPKDGAEKAQARKMGKEEFKKKSKTEQQEILNKHTKNAFSRLGYSLAIGKGIEGTIGIGIGIILAALGLLKIDDDKEYLGPQLVFADTISFSLQDFSPTSMPLILGAVFAQKDATMSLGDRSAAFINAFLDALWIGDLQDLFGNGQTSGEIVASIPQQFVLQFIPAIVKSFAKVVDPYQKDTNYWTKIIASIPGLSYIINNKIDPYTGSKKTNYAKTDAWTSAILAALNALSPMQINYIKDSDVEAASIAADAETSGPSSKITVNGKEIELTDKQYKQLTELRAKLYSQYAAKVINTPYYKKASAEKKKSILKSLQSKATKEARKKLKLT